MQVKIFSVFCRNLANSFSKFSKSYFRISCNYCNTLSSPRQFKFWTNKPSQTCSFIKNNKNHHHLVFSKMLLTYRLLQRKHHISINLRLLNSLGHSIFLNNKTLISNELSENRVSMDFSINEYTNNVRMVYKNLTSVKQLFSRILITSRDENNP